MKPVVALLTLFLVSVVGIVACYSRPFDLLEFSNWGRVISAVPVIGTAAVLTGGALGALLFAFWLCREDRSTFNHAVLGYCYVSPFLIVFTFLPGAQAKPAWAAFNLYTMLTILCVSQVLCGLAIRDWFWSKGGRV
jgi:hypothetical protein